ncbi:sensor domain-containing diguanylate cyclase [Oceanimonas marisflavi]|uniref:sensor domain-containing diguanylate cyclase n=1 Tax=Oceanimonas marisflavi TaxID=2059724 RepID=UPI000D3082DC|nr:diguanylate cyclase [Oceanimonas marisflavi]
MHLRSKLILGLCLLLSGITLAIWLTVRLFMLPQFEASEVQARQQDLERAKRAIYRDLDRLQGFAIDWGEWDDTYRYVQDNNPEYEESNLVGLKLNKIGADLLLITRSDGRIINSGVSGPQAAARLSGSGLLEHTWLTPAHPFNRVLASGGTAILDTPAGPLLLAASAVLPSSGEGRARGVLFFGRFMDAGYRQQLAKRIRLPVEFELTAAGHEKTRVSFVSDSESRVHGTMPLFNNPARELCLIIRQDRPFYAQMLRMMNYAMAIILGLGGLVAVVAYGFLKMTLIGPILQLKQQAETLDSGAPALPGRALRRQDELGQLSRSFYQMAGRLEKSMSMLEAERQQLRAASLTDSLTGLKNRRYMEQYLAAGMQAADTHGWLLMALDLDYFKRVNDEYGHDAGDRVLQQFAGLLQRLCRAEDIVVRYGGEEFVIICKNADERLGCVLAERIRQQVYSFPFGSESEPIVKSCSIGFFTLTWNAARQPSSGWMSVFKVADLALYAAKRSGRNTWVGLKQVGEVPRSGYPGNGEQVRQALAEQRLLSFSAGTAGISWPPA